MSSLIIETPPIIIETPRFKKNSIPDSLSTVTTTTKKEGLEEDEGSQRGIVEKEMARCRDEERLGLCFLRHRYIRLWGVTHQAVLRWQLGVSLNKRQRLQRDVHEYASALDSAQNASFLLDRRGRGFLLLKLSIEGRRLQIILFRWRLSSRDAYNLELQNEIHASVLELMEREAQWKMNLSRYEDNYKRMKGHAFGQGLQRISIIRMRCRISAGAALRNWWLHNKQAQDVNQRYLDTSNRLREFMCALEAANLMVMLRRVLSWRESMLLDKAGKECQEAVELLAALHEDHKRLNSILQVSQGINESDIKGFQSILESDLELMQIRCQVKEGEARIKEVDKALNSTHEALRTSEKELRESKNEIEVLASKLEAQELENEGLHGALDLSHTALMDREEGVRVANRHVVELTEKVAEMGHHKLKLERMEESMQVLQSHLVAMEGDEKVASLELENSQLRETVKRRDVEIRRAMALADAAWGGTTTVIP